MAVAGGKVGVAGGGVEVGGGGVAVGGGSVGVAAGSVGVTGGGVEAADRLHAFNNSKLMIIQYRVTTRDKRVVIV